MIYFQVVDRNLRTFLNGLMPRLPFKATAGETPPGLTDSVIFYDPLVKPTRPGHILPADVSAALETGRPRDAERILVEQIAQVLKGAMVEHDGETEMLAVEEEEHRTRLQQIQIRRAHLNRICGELSAAMNLLKDWKPLEAPPPQAACEVSESSPSVPPSALSLEQEPSAALAESSFLDQLESAVRGVMEKNGGALAPGHFDGTFRLTFDLGLSPPAANPPADLTAPSHRVMHLTGWLVARFSEIYQLSHIRELEEALALVRTARSDLNTRLDRLQQKRREIFHSAGLNLDSDLDRLFQVQHHQFEFDARRRKSPFTIEEKSRYDRFREEIDHLEKKVDSEIYLRFPGSAEFLSTFRRLNQAIVQSLQEWIRMGEDEKEKREMLEKLFEAFRRSAPSERWDRMREQIERLRKFSSLLADRSRRRNFSPGTAPPWPVSPPQVLACLDRIQCLDTTLFPEKFLRRRGPPDILLIPSFGSGLYDWQDGILVISLYPERLQSAVLSALAEFRMDADESKELFNSFGALRRYKGLGFVKLKEAFIADYMAWIEKEAAGFRVMEKEVRSWFEKRIPLGSPAKGAA